MLEKYSIRVHGNPTSRLDSTTAPLPSYPPSNPLHMLRGVLHIQWWLSQCIRKGFNYKQTLSHTLKSLHGLLSCLQQVLVTFWGVGVILPCQQCKKINENSSRHIWNTH